MLLEQASADIEETSVPACAYDADYRRATVLAYILCGLLTVLGLLVPPSMYSDSGWGMLEWRNLISGGPVNSIAGPDPSDLSRDRAVLVTWWSPGQYLVPGIFSLLGLRPGAAFTVTAGISLLACLLGWIRLVRQFALRAPAATLVVLFLSTFRYSTLPFGIYNGGEILLQGITPWLILAGCRVPLASALRAAALAGLAILIGFLAKLSGLMVAGAALIAGSAAVLVHSGRISKGMIAGACGASLAAGLLYVTWFSRGETPASAGAQPFQVSKIFFALWGAWGAGVSWMDLLNWLLLNPQRPILRNSSVMVWLVLPPAVFFAAVMRRGWQRRAEYANLIEPITVAAGFYAVCALVMAVIWSRGGPISLDERHFRSAGTLILVCVVGVAQSLPGKLAWRRAVVIFCSFMSLYGMASLVNRARSTRPEDIDPYSRTHQVIVDMGAIQFARAAFVREGRDALFILPSPDIAAALPIGVRMLSIHLDFESEAEIAARRFAGKVRGHVYVVMQTRLTESKGEVFLKGLVDYPVNAWVRHQFGETTVFVQATPVNSHASPEHART